MEGAHPGGVVPGAAGNRAEPARGGAPLLRPHREKGGASGMQWGRSEKRLGK